MAVQPESGHDHDHDRGVASCSGRRIRSGSPGAVVAARAQLAWCRLALAEGGCFPG